MASPTPFEKKVVWGASFGPDVRLPLNTDNGNLVLSLKMDNGFQQTHFNDPGLAYEIFGRDGFRYFRTDPKEHYVLLYVYSADTKKEFDFAYVTHSSPMLVCWPWVGCQITKMKDWIFKEYVPISLTTTFRIQLIMIDRKSYFFEEETRFWRGTWPNLDVSTTTSGRGSCGLTKTFVAHR